jgi:hypothetical protein
LHGYLPHLICFETFHAASEVCRFSNFGTSRVDFADATSYHVDDFLTVMVTSHEELAAQGWRDYGADHCVLDTETWKLKVTSSVIHHHQPFRWDVRSRAPFHI